MAGLLFGLAGPARSTEPATRTGRPATRPQPPIAERYALADRFQHPAANALFADGDLRATFTDDSRFLMY